MTGFTLFSCCLSVSLPCGAMGRLCYVIVAVLGNTHMLFYLFCSLEFSWGSRGGSLESPFLPPPPFKYPINME